MDAGAADGLKEGGRETDRRRLKVIVFIRVRR